MDIKHIAKLANLPLSDREETKLQKQLTETVDFFNDLKKVDTKGLPLTSQVTEKTNELRDDNITPCLSQEDALKNGAKAHNGFFVAKAVWD